ncbi:MAG TPA: hypothetical protein VGL99_11285 [Chloroflexota bacterium]
MRALIGVVARVTDQVVDPWQGIGCVRAIAAARAMNDLELVELRRRGLARTNSDLLGRP